MDGSGNIFVASAQQNAVVEIPASGGPQTLLGSGLNYPNGLAVDSSGNLFVADTDNDRIVKIAAGSGVETTVASGLRGLWGVAVDASSNLFVATDSIVAEIAPGGAQITLSPLEDSALYLAVDSANNVYVTLEYANTVVKLGANGNSFGGVNVCPAGQTAPSPCSQTLTLAFATSTVDTLTPVNVVTQGIANQDFTVANSTCIGATPNEVAQCTVGVTFTPSAPGLRSGVVQLTDASGVVLSTPIYGIGDAPQMAFAPAPSNTFVNSMSSAFTGAAVDAAGNLFVVDTQNNQVLKIAPGGAQSTVASGLNLPFGVALDGAGNVYICDSHNARVLQVSPTGAQTTVGSGWSQPYSVAVDGAGNVFVGDTGTNALMKITPMGVQSTVANQGAFGLAVDATGNLYAANPAGKSVLKISPSGVQTPIGSGWESPQAVAVDGAGDVYVSDGGATSLQQVAPNGTQTTLPFAVGFGLALDDSGNLYITSGGMVLQAQRAMAPTLTFAATPMGSTSSDSPQSVTVQNIGTAALAATGLTVGTNFAQVAGSGSPADCTANFSLVAGTSCNLSISFTPTAVGSIQSSVMLTDNALNANPATQYITLNGTGQVGSQTISFGSIPAQTAGGTLALSASATSGLPVSFTSLTPSVCTVSGTTATMVTAGTCSIQATQAGNASYAAAAPVTQGFAVNQASQTITFTGLPATAIYGAAGPYTVNATASSALAVAYTVTGPASISGSTLTITGAGTVMVTAAQAGNSYYAAATPVVQTITVSAASQTITFTGLPATATYGSAGPYTLSAPATSGLPVSFSVSGPVSISGSTLTITGVGSVVVTASQAGNTNYAAATPASQTITVSAESQTLTFTGLPATATYGSAGPYTLSATASSGLLVSYSVTGPASISGSTLTITGAGTVTVTASQAGNTNYKAATPVSQSIVVSAESQTITFSAIPAQTVGANVALTASASSGLPVSFASSTPAVCTVSGPTATMVAAGTCSVQASQPGNAQYAAATPVTQSFTVNAGTSFTITPIPGSETVNPGVELGGFILELQSVKGFNGNVTLSCSSSINSSVCVDLPQTVHVDGTALALTGILFPANTKAGTYTITFTGVSGSLTETATATFTVK